MPIVVLVLGKKMRKRAEAVDLKLLGSGRQSKGAREKWLEELERLELEKFGRIIE